ncbi:hypothetical protein A1O1_04123 [Capronia coronata CBS 617.96]|uniref:T6SS Phospholipase effector Tle1-like catalytic domain-containing protein n=1 Tax=Capronia coronata CBS 617.96 TaxID=1182541 RepID=W9YP57_9EURO|nr:uncharacterized protein A1O1_04123 [Capronia coronata CBS 617.96]EXJ91016.1 hypothetical protein A1O1_04123 [Capronia coronata CBS 617.96]
MAFEHNNLNRRKNVFVLCFDGTGNKFSGTDADSNILKLYRMLDRSDASMYTFYQPGIGTYVTSHSMQTTSMFGRIRSAYLKAKDSAVGSSFADHVMGGYQFLMRYYSPEDDLYFFGFSRGAYTARFLAEMLDHIGLLSAGNEELIRFAWKTYAKWACRRNDGTEKAIRDEKEQYAFMRGFRQTFSRPVRRIRFLGLFDTVNSVPRFESAWMARTKFPYTARSSAKVIRHAVSIDERRAKFRQDLIGATHQRPGADNKSHEMHQYGSDFNHINKKLNEANEGEGEGEGERRGLLRSNSGSRAVIDPGSGTTVPPSPEENEGHGQDQSQRGRLLVPSSQARTQISSDSLAAPAYTPSTEDLQSTSGKSDRQHNDRRLRRRWSENRQTQDIQEVWFSGGHGDVGGGWSKVHHEEKMLSHVPLVWMVLEAERAGLRFDPSKMADCSCLPDKLGECGERLRDHVCSKHFLQHLEDCSSHGLVHDCLEIDHGLTWGDVFFWRIMEYLPFRRMDLHHGKWRAIRWPLPMGETRDIPADAHIHNSVIKRMQACTDYRPGNLIVGGGGRGVRKAPEKYGIGEWVPHSFEGDPVRETLVREHSPEDDRKESRLSRPERQKIRHEGKQCEKNAGEC